MRETRSKDIDGVTFTVQQLPALRASRLLFKLTKAVSPAVMKLAGAGDLRNLMRADTSALSEAASMLFQAFTPEEFDALVREVLEGATITVDGRTVAALPGVDLELAGKTATLMRGVWFALGVNFGDFFDVLRGLVAAGAAPATVIPSK